MKDQFVTYEIAKALDKLGFSQTTTFSNITSLYSESGSHVFYSNYGFMYSGLSDGYIKAPLWSQVTDWLREKYDINIFLSPYYEGQRGSQYVQTWYYMIYRSGLKVYDQKDYFTSFTKNNYQKARIQSILKSFKIIELIKKETK